MYKIDLKSSLITINYKSKLLLFKIFAKKESLNFNLNVESIFNLCFSCKCKFFLGFLSCLIY